MARGLRLPGGTPGSFTPSMGGASIVQQPTMTRRNRYPQHNFHLRQLAQVIQPFLIAPVLPGETLKSALFQSRVVSDPVKDPLTGWWIEYYFFYVKHRDLVSPNNSANLSTDLQEMMLDVNKSMAAHNEVADVTLHHLGGAMNYAKQCLIRVVEEYFRDEGEAWNNFTAGGLPVASIGRSTVLQSAIAATEYSSADVSLTVGVDDAITASEMEAVQREYEFMRLQGITNMSYEDYLASYGIRTRAEEINRPELLRYVREWTYPANTVEPTTGVPASALSWVMQERLSKPRLFREPGFVFGVTVARPKMYLSNLRGNVVDYLNDAFSWLPAALMGERSHSIKNFVAGAGPVPTLTVDHVMDMRDLFLYGDDFTNVDQATAVYPGVNLPGATMSNMKYPSSAAIDALFKVGASNKVKQDGVVSLTIAGMQADLTPGRIP